MESYKSIQMMKKYQFFLNKIFLLFTVYCLLITGNSIKAQELNCKVSLSTDQLQVNEQRGSNVYNEIQNVMQEFLNNRRWSNDNFSTEEKINCSLSVILTKASSNGDYEGTANFQVRRPIFGTAYETVLLNYVDKNFTFKYVAGTPLTYNDNNFNDNLTQMLAFYAYVALAFDYDSFGKMGGTNFAQKALNVVNLAQSAGGGWTSSSDIRNRYWVSENLLNQQLQPLREGFYTYHRLAMDNYATNPVGGRKQITEYLNQIKQISQSRPGQVWYRLFFEAKSIELLNIYGDAPLDERKKIVSLLTSLDPTNSESYRKLGK
ncbi:DUF4835 family protein [Arcicella sp. LKC2W]|uniref:type IX secretion system protein PorD n=1 Tax=Arcicella sp. LKC2W TaxID=2984198 RepID=UPI002B20682B|nr:DUF4835 family protein [Arcicella sp. LKC2W]MEA5461323.1 DUF4835 family protein [Arcicella sp. LKC2W]